MDRDTLAEFLRGRREALSPTDVGLPTGPRRRTAGLRREEVAQLTGMSVDYYARLEQRRTPQPSVRMLVGLARTMRLSRDERDYLFRLAGHTPPDGGGLSVHVRPGLLRVLDQLVDCAAFVVSDLDAMLAQNRLSTLLMGDRRAPRAGVAASMTWQRFTDVSTRDLFPREDHRAQSRIRVADLRATWSRRRGDPDVTGVVDGLLARSDEFRALWDCHDVAVRHGEHKRFLHPKVGTLTLGCELLAIGDGDQRLVILSAASTSESLRKLRLLSVLGNQDVGARTTVGR